MAVSKGIGTIDEDDIQIPGQLPVLKGIVQEQHLCSQHADCHLTRAGPFPSDEDGDAGKAARHEQGFVAAGSGIQQDMLPVRHDRRSLFSPGAVSPVQKGRFVSPMAEPTGQVTRRGSLTRPAGSDIPQADDRDWQMDLLFRMGQIRPVPVAYAPAIQYRKS